MPNSFQINNNEGKTTKGKTHFPDKSETKSVLKISEIECCCYDKGNLKSNIMFERFDPFPVD